jgi:hypothetical protein
MPCPDNAYSYLSARLIGRSRVWVEDLGFEAVSNDVPTTDQNRLLGGYDRCYSEPKFLSEAPINLDFEEEYLP